MNIEVLLEDFEKSFMYLSNNEPLEIETSNYPKKSKYFYTRFLKNACEKMEFNSYDIFEYAKKYHYILSIVDEKIAKSSIYDGMIKELVFMDTYLEEFVDFVEFLENKGIKYNLPQKKIQYMDMDLFFSQYDSTQLDGFINYVKYFKSKNIRCFNDLFISGIINRMIKDEYITFYDIYKASIELYSDNLRIRMTKIKDEFLNKAKNIITGSRDYGFEIVPALNNEILNFSEFLSLFGNNEEMGFLDSIKGLLTLMEYEEIKNYINSIKK